MSTAGRGGQQPIDRWPFNSPVVQSRLGRTVGRWLLPLWFAFNSLSLLFYMLGNPPSFGFDVRLYRLAAEAWLAGRDAWAPALFWDAAHPGISYAGPPPTLLPFLVLAWIPVEVLVLLVALASAAAAMWTLRRLKMPIWWMLFPPIVQGIWVGNLNLFVIALLVWGGTLAGGLATVFKGYAAVPLLLLGRWKPLVAAGAFLLVTFPFLPWAQFLAQYGRITAALAGQAWGGTEGVLPAPFLTIGAVIGLVLVGREKAAWLAVPALWPSTQLHYTVIALPAMSPILGFFGALDRPGYFAIGVLIYGIWMRADPLHRRRPPDPA